MVDVLKKPTSLAMLVLILALALVTAKFIIPSTARAADPAVPSSPLAVALIRTGLDAESLAVAGVNESGVVTLATKAKTHFATAASSFAQADTSYAHAKKAFDVLERKVQSGLAATEEVVQCNTAKSTLTAAASARDAALDAVIATSTSSLTDAQQATLATIRSNRKTWEVPTEYLAANRTEAQWCALRDALACKRIAEREGETLDAVSSALLAQVDAEAAIAAAKTNLATYKATSIAAWNQALAN